MPHTIHEWSIMIEMNDNGSEIFMRLFRGIVKFNCSRGLKNLSKNVRTPY